MQISAFTLSEVEVQDKLSAGYYHELVLGRQLTFKNMIDHSTALGQAQCGSQDDLA